MPVWGVWLETAILFSTGRQSRKLRNLQANPRCVVCIEIGDQALSVEGRAEAVTDPAALSRFAAVYAAKYQWNMEGFAEPVFAVNPTVAFAFLSGAGEFTGSATRWRFE